MKSRHVYGGAGLLLLIGLLAKAAPVEAADVYRVDPVHSSVHFRVKHFGVGYVWGRFNDMSGSFTWDEQTPAECALEIEVKTPTIDSGNAKRDQHLKGPDFFDVAQFPTATFKSTQVRKLDEHNYEVAGELTMHGQTRPVTARLEWVGAGKDPRGGARAGFEAVLTIKRSEFGMNKMLQGIGDDVRIIAALEGTR
jgi:polyisoprenoid-binding protein YceI